MPTSHYKARFGKALIGFLDILVVIVLFISIREYLNYGHIVDQTTFSRIEFSLWHFIALIILPVIWNRIFTVTGMYRFRQKIGWLKHLRQIVMASSLGVATMLFAAELIGMTAIGQKFTLIFWLTIVSVFLIYRSVLYGLLYLARLQKRNIKHIVIVGLNQRSVSLLKDLRKPELGYNILGFVDHEARQDMVSEDMNTTFLCTLSNFDKYISKYPVDEVIITLPMRSLYDEIARIIEICARQGIKSRLVTNLFDLPSNVPFNLGSDSSATAINFVAEPLTEFQQDLKRFFDIVVSGIALIVFSPVFLIVSIIIMIDEGLPIFFAQERIGHNKRRFKMFKFRTMIRSAEKMQATLEDLNETDGAVFKIANDPRITRTGNFLRKTSIDELPQLLNVFFGSMSLVGPRPLPVRDFELFYDDTHRRRFSVKPGITGLWQVSGRSGINFDEWMRLDLQYIDNWSPMLEFKILIMTIPAVFSGRGAE